MKKKTKTTRLFMFFKLRTFFVYFILYINDIYYFILQINDIQSYLNKAKN